MLLFRQSDLQFLSTLSLRRATGGKQSFIRMDRIFLSTLSLRRATLSALVLQVIPVDFYPRSPCGERHLCPGAACSNKLISIHALLAESDAPVGIADGTIQSDFYPRSPCGERRRVGPQPRKRVGFLSTLSLRRATSALERPAHQPAISIHALLAESDPASYMALAISCRFLSTLSLRRATHPFAK